MWCPMVVTDGCGPWCLYVTKIRVIKLKNTLCKKSLKWNEIVFFLCCFSSLMPNRLLMPISQKWDISCAADATCFYCCQLCLLCSQEDALPIWSSTSLVLFSPIPWMLSGARTPVFLYPFTCHIAQILT